MDSASVGYVANLPSGSAPTTTDCGSGTLAQNQRPRTVPYPAESKLGWKQGALAMRIGRYATTLCARVITTMLNGKYPPGQRAPLASTTAGRCWLRWIHHRRELHANPLPDSLMDQWARLATRSNHVAAKAASEKTSIKPPAHASQALQATAYASRSPLANHQTPSDHHCEATTPGRSAAANPKDYGPPS